jgi:hypothetical protein
MVKFFLSTGMLPSSISSRIPVGQVGEHRGPAKPIRNNRLAVSVYQPGDLVWINVAVYERPLWVAGTVVTKDVEPDSYFVHQNGTVSTASFSTRTCDLRPR